jgi:hypothetical protein
MLTSLIVFVPTTAVGMLFRRVRRRVFVGIKQSEWSDADLTKVRIDVRGGVNFDTLGLALRSKWLINVPALFTTAGAAAAAQLVSADVPGLVCALVGRAAAVLDGVWRLDCVLVLYPALRRHVHL